MTAPNIVMYTTAWCPYCTRARALFQQKGVAFTEIDIEAEPARRSEMMERSQRRTVPQIFINDQHIGGCDDLYALEAQGGIDPLLAR
jgi:glutaredoxin 3